MYVHRCRYAFSMRLDNDEDDEDGEVVGSQHGSRYRCDVGTVVRRGRERNGTARSIDETTTGSMTETAADGCGKGGNRRKQVDRRSGTLRFLIPSSRAFPRERRTPFVSLLYVSRPPPPLPSPPSPPRSRYLRNLSICLSTPRVNIHPERARNE